VREAERLVGDAVLVHVDADSPHLRFWIERGYEVEGGLYHMTAEPEGIKPLPDVPAGTVLRSLKPDEEKELVKVVNTSYGWERLREDSIARWKEEHPPLTRSGSRG